MMTSSRAANPRSSLQDFGKKGGHVTTWSQAGNEKKVPLARPFRHSHTWGKRGSAISREARCKTCMGWRCA